MLFASLFAFAVLAAGCVDKVDPGKGEIDPELPPASPLPGPSGNVEYFLWLSWPGGRMGLDDRAGLGPEELAAAIDRAITEGPQ